MKTINDFKNLNSYINYLSKEFYFGCYKLFSNFSKSDMVNFKNLLDFIMEVYNNAND